MEQNSEKNLNLQVTEEEVYQLANRLGIEFSGPNQISQIYKVDSRNSTNLTSMLYIYSTYISQITGLGCEHTLYHSGGGWFRFYTGIGPQNVKQIVLDIDYFPSGINKSVLVKFHYSSGQKHWKFSWEEFTDRFETIDWKHLLELVTNHLSDASNKLCSTVINQFNSVNCTFTRIEDVCDYINQKIKEESDRRHLPFYQTLDQNSRSLDDLLQNLKLLFEMDLNIFTENALVVYYRNGDTYRLRTEPDFSILNNKSKLKPVGRGIKLSVRDESRTNWNFGFGIVGNQFMFWMTDLTFSTNILQGAETVCKLDFNHLCNQLSEVVEQITFEEEKLGLELMLEFNL